MTPSASITSGVIDSISQASRTIEKLNRPDIDTMIKVMREATRYLSEENPNPQLLKEITLAVRDLQGRLVQNGELEPLIDAISLLTNNISSSFVEIVPEESGGLCSRRCIPKFGNGEFYYHADRNLTSDNPQFDTKGYPSEAHTPAEYFERIDRFSYLEQEKPSTSISYYLSSTTLTTPGTVVIEGVEKNTAIRCRSQVECDLGRYTTVTIDKVLMYSENSQMTQNEKASSIMIKLRNTFNHSQIAQSVSRLMTQATIAGASVDFFVRFTNQMLNFGSNSPERLDIVVRNNRKDVEVSFYALYHIRNLTRLCEVGDVKKLPIFRSCVVSRKIVISKASLKRGSSEGGRILDAYSKFFGVKESAEKHLHSQLSNS